MKFIRQFVLVLLFFLLVTPAFAMTVRTSQAVTVGKDEVVTGTLFAGGNTVTIDGTIHGDLLCGSQSVLITGLVDGDVICAGQSIHIDGAVTGSVRAAGQSIEIAGPVGRNVTIAAQTLMLDRSSTVSGEVLFAGQTLTNLSGVTNITEVTPKPEKKTPVTTVTKATKKTGGLLGKIIFYLVVAFIAQAIAPKWLKKILTSMGDNPVRKALIGFGALMGGAFIILMMAITIIGIPFAVLAAILFGLMIVVSEVLATIFIGSYLLNRFNANRKHEMYKNILVGVPVSCLVFAVPILGGFASFLGVIWGMGAILKSKK